MSEAPETLSAADDGDGLIRLRLGTNLKRLRTARNLSLDGLSARMEQFTGHVLGTNALWKIEKGTRGTSVEDLMALALMLDVAVAELLMPLEAETPERADKDKGPLRALPVIRGAAVAPGRYLEMIGANAHPEIIRNVSVTDPDGHPYWVRPGDRPPGWALLQIKNPSAYLAGQVPPMLSELQEEAEQAVRRAVEAAAGAASQSAARAVGAHVDATIAPLIEQVKEHLSVTKSEREQWVSSREWFRLDLQVALHRLNAVIAYAIDHGVPAAELLEVSTRAEIAARGGTPDMTLDQALQAQVKQSIIDHPDDSGHEEITFHPRASPIGPASS